MNAKESKDVETSEPEKMSAEDALFQRQLIVQLISGEAPAFNSRGVPASLEKLYRWTLEIIDFDRKVQEGYRPAAPKTGRRTTKVEYPDPDTGEMITRMEFVDEDAFHPNLPKSHPFNQKSAHYLDGKDLEESQRSATSQLPVAIG